MTTYERLISELSSDLGVDLAPDRAGVTMVSAEDRIVLIRADETNEQELTIFTTIAKAPEGGFPSDTLARALEMNLFGQEVVGHHLGLFVNSLVLSASLPLPGLTPESLAERLVMLARVAKELSNTLKAAPAEPAANASPSSIGDGFIFA